MSVKCRLVRGRMIMHVHGPVGVRGLDLNCGSSSSGIARSRLLEYSRSDRALNTLQNGTISHGAKSIPNSAKF
jgi:hypothetical protein